ncbi:hypothetical protein WT60_00150 [Burkholderia sp. MSMB617WGS]|uniref:Transposase n=1 Tax=Burkholderia savannae TaxID=1637837 RepID=A0ABR5T905_9BURK|nr:hypothetical protein WS78_18175 [Burkholderia savannae]AOK45443.1 hypothetical protein WT60_00150 [Burkholderia sp. MSMB617WGS]KVG47411.1 hypothetical protein WS77_04470 [Burkholderia sp. MSMB0265]KVG82363.1 hypothetical protein WS81_01035 [Burkholderia sp. MSMB2040]KVG92606.1 hypothetical protein WS82_10320 [Burkholderia sp. MSMB2041]KVG98465.1 hypothetical protein WS83_28115 [Burkholderia sp. MSMB2042]KVK76962.1 hypothetical protein WS91_00670 [Burkholderia sp. MSMB1498]
MRDAGISHGAQLDALRNRVGCMMANSIIFYNSGIPWRLLTKSKAGGTIAALARLTHISSAAWRQILLNGHYTFQSNNKIDLDALVEGPELMEISGVPA